MNKDTDRARQFLAFAALSGFEQLLEEEEQAAQAEEDRFAEEAPEPAPLPEDGA